MRHASDFSCVKTLALQDCSLGIVARVGAEVNLHFVGKSSDLLGLGN